MEALVAVGVASNVVQFVDFAAKLIQTSNELRHGAASSENKDYSLVATHLEVLAGGIHDRPQAIAQCSAAASAEEKVKREKMWRPFLKYAKNFAPLGAWALISSLYHHIESYTSFNVNTLERCVMC
jgi:hypothetical protein